MSAPRTNSKSIDGVWQLVRAEMNGEAAPELLASQIKLELFDGVYIVRFDDQVTDRGTLEFAEMLGPKSFVMRRFTSENTQHAIPCIFRHAGDMLQVCFGIDGLLPTEFTTSPSQQRYLATYKKRSLF